MIPDSDPPSLALRLLILWFRAEGRLPDTDTPKADEIGRALGMKDSKALNKLLRRDDNRDRLQSQAETVAANLRPLLTAMEPLPPEIRALMDTVYGPEPEVPLNDPTKPVKSPSVLREKSMTTTTGAPPVDAAMVYGLNLLVRPANETVRAGFRQYVEGWSLALLTVPPPHIQEGHHHPVFKLIQASSSDGYTTFGIEGILVPRSDRLLLQGVEAAERKTFTAVLSTPPDALRTYNDTAAETATPLFGAMLGLSNAKQNFASFFHCYHVPGTALLPQATDLDHQAFRDRYNALKRAAGVRTFEDTLKTLHANGVHAPPERLNRLRERSEVGLIFNPFK